MYHKIGIVVTDCNRQAIQNSRREWWTGDGWSTDKLNRQLYDTNEAVSVAYNEMLDKISFDLPVREFEVPLKIVVYTNGVFDRNDLIQYMQNAFEFTMDVAHVGVGPTPARSRTDVEINWDELNETSAPLEEW